MDIDTNLVIEDDAVKATVLEHLDIIATFTGTDVFLLGPRPTDPETVGSNFNGSPDTGLDQRLRVAAYGDMESAEHAKTRTLIMIDQIVGSDMALKTIGYMANRIMTAQTDGRCDEGRSVVTHPHLWTVTEEHQADRIGDEYGHLLPSAMPTSLRISSARCASKE